RRSTAFWASANWVDTGASACSLNCCSIVLAKSQLKKSRAFWPWHSGWRKPQESAGEFVKVVSLKMRSALSALAHGFSVVGVYVYFIRHLAVGRLQQESTPFDRDLDLFGARPECG